jgi:hypothetical protein
MYSYIARSLVDRQISAVSPHFTISNGIASVPISSVPISHYDIMSSKGDAHANAGRWNDVRFR